MEPDFSELSLYLPSLPAGSPLPDSITLEQCWQEAEDAFSEVQSVPLQMLVIFGGLEDEERCLTASAVVTEVSAGGAGTRIRFKDLRPIESRPLIPSLRNDEDAHWRLKTLPRRGWFRHRCFCLRKRRPFC